MRMANALCYIVAEEWPPPSPPLDNTIFYLLIATNAPAPSNMPIAFIFVLRALSALDAFLFVIALVPLAVVLFCCVHSQLTYIRFAYFNYLESGDARIDGLEI